MKREFVRLLGLLLLTTHVALANAQTVVIGTPPPTGNPGGGYIAIGDLEGQSFTVPPTASILNSITIYYTRGYASTPAYADYGFGIWRWNQNPYALSGPMLFARTGTLQSQGDFALVPLTFDTGSLALDPGGVYVAMLWQTGGTGAIFLPNAGIVYDGGGRAGCRPSLDQCGQLLDSQYFSATFSPSPAANIVPTVSQEAMGVTSLLLLVFGLTLLRNRS